MKYFCIVSRAKIDKMKSAKTPTSPTLPVVAVKSCDSQVTNTGCRVQVRLPNGRVLRQNFMPSQNLSHVIEFVRENCPEIANIQLAQVSYCTFTYIIIMPRYSLWL